MLMLRACAGFSAGVLLVFFAPSLLFLLLSLLSAGFLVSAHYFRKRYLHQHSGHFFGVSLLLSLCVGVAVAGISITRQQALQVSPEIIGTTVLASGHIVGMPETDDGPLRFRLKVTGSDNPLLKHGALLRLSWYWAEERPQPGELWQLPVRLKPPRGMLNFHGFDYEAWLFRERISGTGYVRGSGQRLAAADSLFRGGLTRWRLQLAGAIAPASLELLDEVRDHSAKNAGDNAEAREVGRGLLQALTLGDRRNLDEGVWQTLRQTGTSHLIAISGLHIGLVAGLVFWLFSRLLACIPPLANRIAAPRVAALVAIAAALAYAALAGFSLPTQRAVIMLAIAFSCIWFRVTIQPWAGWFLAFALVLCWAPASALAGGFWLSFLAVAWIIYLLADRYPRPSGWRLLLRIQLILAVGLWPVTLFFFGSASFSAPLVNLIAVPLIGFVLVPGALLAVLLQPVSDKPVTLMADLLGWLYGGLQQLAALPGTQWQLNPPLWLVVLAVLSAVLLALPRGWPGRWAGLPGLLLLLLWQPVVPNKGQFELTVLDVGQGLSMLLRTKEHSLLFDAGARSGSGFDVGERIVLPELQAMNITRLDKAIISHGDNDHRGGMPAILSKLPVDDLLFGGRDVPIWQLNQQRCEQGQRWQWDDVNFEVLWPPAAMAESELSENDLSCVLVVTTGKQAVLLTGDIEAAAEGALPLNDWIKRQPHSYQWFLQVPHHGSRSSSTERLLDALNLQQAAVSAGYRNRFGHPHIEVVDRYADRAVSVWETNKHGALKWRFDGSDTSPFPVIARETRAGLWRSAAAK